MQDNGDGWKEKGCLGLGAKEDLGRIYLQPEKEDQSVPKGRDLGTKLNDKASLGKQSLGTLEKRGMSIKVREKLIE